MNNQEKLQQKRKNAEAKLKARRNKFNKVKEVQKTKFSKTIEDNGIPEGAIVTIKKEYVKDYFDLSPEQQESVPINNLGQTKYNKDGSIFLQWTPEYFNSLSEEALQKMPEKQRQEGLAFLAKHYNNKLDGDDDDDYDNEDEGEDKSFRPKHKTFISTIIGLIVVIIVGQTVIGQIKESVGASLSLNNSSVEAATMGTAIDMMGIVITISIVILAFTIIRALLNVFSDEDDNE